MRYGQLCFYLILSFLLCFSCTAKQQAFSGSQENNLPAQDDGDAQPRSIRFMAVGDFIAHDALTQEAKKRAMEQGRPEGYDYASMFSPLQPLLDRADLLFINQESMVNPQQPIAGYPNFNAPVELIDDIARAGFNLVSIANNHALDSYEEGFLATASYWAKHWPEVAVSGKWAENPATSIELIRVHGIDISFAAFTYDGNENFSQAESLMRIDSPEFDRAIKAVCAQGDINIVSLHTGIEDSAEITPADRDLAQKMLDAGVEIVLMHHSHVLKNIELTKNSQGNDALVIYSLGNFLHTQLSEAQRLGAVFDVLLTLDQGRLRIDRPLLHPFYLWYRWGDLQKKELLSRQDIITLPLAELHKYSDYAHQAELVSRLASVVDGEFLPYIPRAPYTDIKTVQDAHSLLVLINKQNRLPENFGPMPLASPSVEFSKRTSSSVHVIDKRIVASVEALFTAAQKEGHSLVFVSGYRDRQTQRQLWQGYAQRSGEHMADSFSARPGHSEHESGLAFDVSEASIDALGLSAFVDTAAALWLEKNAHTFGFIIRYPRLKEDITQFSYEPWHLRYVGGEVAKKIYEKKLCLEEYVHQLK